ncbi:hypothetical protein BVC93_11985 [Mycobacterium sp. MS1601]|uniref:gamma-glutamyltransferase n=1 Tax=Mycobacterium sp. MS1601 TaxID=1936029 RepID=UPI0009796616|nr:gamma-glutamyltransferase [Mycobacterium sp. MS1601]AQA03034.1 hypothetical protein BVC93_11985 [Mycobacterium sp. MS1601]
MEILARRATAVGSGGAVAAGSRTAAAIGARALADGGNAFDAVLSAALAETVALPSKCGLAGDVVALYLTSGSSAPRSLVSVGGAARGLYDAAASAGWPTPLTGPLSVGVPGAPAGYARVAELASMPLARLAAPAIELARRGIWWSSMNTLLAQESRALLREYQPNGCVYAPLQAPHAEGDIVRLPGLADALEEFALCREALFGGPVGTATLKTVERHGGPLSAVDLLSVQPVDEPAHSVETHCGPVWATNAPTFGPSLTSVLAGLDPSTLGSHDARRALSARTNDEGTSTVAAVDAAGNAVVMVHSLSFPQYGSGLVVDGFDLILSNRAGRGFTFAPEHPDSPVPGRRPPTTLHAWGIRFGEGWLLGGTPGGRQQLPWNMQVLGHLMGAPAHRPEHAIGAALCAPRWELAADGTDRLEGRDMPQLSARSGHTVVGRGFPGCVAGADPRWDGAAVAI